LGEADQVMAFTLFRTYQPRLARWLSPDPVAGSILNPQSLNRYAYVVNNPTNFLHPLGPQEERPHQVTWNFGIGGLWFSGGICVSFVFAVPERPPFDTAGEWRTLNSILRLVNASVSSREWYHRL
jgi:RHS repeat-associated protein